MLRLRTSNNAKGVFNMLNTTGVSSFRNVLNAGGMFGDGLATIIRQLGPLISYMSNGLENMADVSKHLQIVNKRDRYCRLYKLHQSKFTDCW